MPAAAGPVLVMGAGSIGCYLGGRLAAAGREVAFVGRPRVLRALARHGLTLQERGRPPATLPAAALALHEQPPSALRPALVLLCVKSGAVEVASQALDAVLPAGTPVIALQNGLHAATRAGAAAPRLRVLAGMVPYNVAELGPGSYLRGSDGALALQDDPVTRAWLEPLRAAGLAARTWPDMRAVQWAKLLLNLNNPVNALSGLHLRAQLLDAALRAETAALMDEALALLRLAGQPLARLTPLPPGWLPTVLRLPTPLFRLLAARMLNIDWRARSSMADDLALGRPTEIDALCGEVVRLAESLGRQAPRNEAMMRRLRSASRGALQCPS